MPRRGYLTMAVGSERFLEMAVDMVLSLRDHSPHPAALVADEAIAAVASAHYPDVFDEVVLVDERFRDGRALKYGLAEASPWDESAFIDADCFVLGSLDHCWASLTDHDMAMLGELLTADDDENHHGFSTRTLMRTFDLDRYLKTNSGFFCFRTEPSRRIMEAMRRCYLDEVRPRLRWQILLGRWLGDEIAIGIVGGRERLGTLPKPGEMYWPDEFADLDLDAPTKPLLHWIWPLTPGQYSTVTKRARSRREAAGVRDVGDAHWAREQENLETMARRRRMLERFRIW